VLVVISVGMNTRISHIELRNNKEIRQFETTVDNSVALIEYTISDNRIFLTHTEVPDALKGRGIGSLLVKETLEEIERLNLQVIPACKFVKRFIQKNPEYRRLLATGIDV
jgi:predicted GNAT family acetyltransferase